MTSCTGILAGSKFNRSAGPNLRRRVKICYFLFAAFHHSQWFLRISISLFNIFRPNSPEFLSSVVIRKVEIATANMSIMIAMLSAVVQLYLLTCFTQTAQLLVGPVYIFMFTMPDFLRNFPPVPYGSTLKRRRDTLLSTPSFGTNPGNGLRVQLGFYRCLQLLTNEFSDLYAKLHGFLHLIMITLVGVCLYGSVRTTGVMAVVQAYLGLWWLLGYGMAIDAYAGIHKRSIVWLRSLRAQCLKLQRSRHRQGSSSVRIIDRELRSLQELRITGGSSTFYFDKGLILTTIGIIMNQASNLLIMR